MTGRLLCRICRRIAAIRRVVCRVSTGEFSWVSCRIAGVLVCRIGCWVSTREFGRVNARVCAWKPGRVDARIDARVGAWKPRRIHARVFCRIAGWKARLRLVASVDWVLGRVISRISG